ncbi:MAG: metallophosphoesterase family protein [Bacteroidetes bacterium]|nr:metallophosphoesterase family protein [Bacteroidota bacterium]
MTKIGLLSDTHGYVDPLLSTYFKDVDEIWHAGDIGTPEVIDELAEFALVRAVHGNIDGGVLRQHFPHDLFFKCEDVNVWITHIAGHPGRYGKRIREYLKVRTAPDLFVCGHSHILKVMRDKKNNFLHMNPGAAGYHGFHKVKTVLRFTIDKKNIQDLEVIELGPRAKTH